MTTSAKFTFGLLILILLAAGGVWFANHSAMQQVTPEQPLQTHATTTVSQPAQSAANFSSDSSIANDMTNVDAQINGLTSDSANADQSLNDKQITQ